MKELKFSNTLVSQNCICLCNKYCTLQNISLTNIYKIYGFKSNMHSNNTAIKVDQSLLLGYSLVVKPKRIYDCLNILA